MGSIELESLDWFRLRSATELTETETFASQNQANLRKSNNFSVELSRTPIV